MTPLNRILLAVGVALLCQACSSVQSRIDRNPELFAALPPEQQELVLNEEVREGMTKDAVYLAWGRPDREVVRSQEGRQIDIWIYMLRRTTAIPAFSYGVGFGGYRGGWGNVWVDVPVYDPVYVTEEEPSRSVEFHRGKVIGWSRTTGW